MGKDGNIQNVALSDFLFTNDLVTIMGSDSEENMIVTCVSTEQ